MQAFPQDSAYFVQTFDILYTLTFMILCFVSFFPTEKKEAHTSLHKRKTE